MIHEEKNITDKQTSRFTFAARIRTSLASSDHGLLLCMPLKKKKNAT